MKSRLSDLSDDTPIFFKKLPGYDTLRLVLSKYAILVEGASDELIIQKAYMAINSGRLPIIDGIDIISVGTSFLRFIEIASQLNKRIAVVTDNDGNTSAIESKYYNYLGENRKENIFISYDKNNRTPEESPIPDYNYNTLENLMLISNGVANMNKILNKKYKSEDDLRKHMKGNKTDCALSIFEYSGSITFPDYITEAIKHVK